MVAQGQIPRGKTASLRYQLARAWSADHVIAADFIHAAIADRGIPSRPPSLLLFSPLCCRPLLLLLSVFCAQKKGVRAEGGREREREGAQASGGKEGRMEHGKDVGREGGGEGESE